MTPDFETTLGQAAELLAKLPKWAPHLDEAKELFAGLEQRFPAVQMELVSHQDAQELSVDFDLFLQWPTGGILALSFTPEDGLPWCAIQAEHWAANLVVTVNDQQITVQQALWLFKQNPGSEDGDLMRRLVDSALIRQALEENPVSVSDEELQEAADLFRLANGLADAATTHAWMARRGLTDEAFEGLLRDNVESRRLVERVTESELEGYFERHRETLATVALVRAAAPDAESAERLADRARAHHDLLVAAREAASAPGGEQLAVSLRTVRCDQLEPELTEPVLHAAPGDLIGPLTLSGGHEVLQVVTREPARFDAASREAVRERLFRRWLAEQRDSAKIVWHWMV